MTQIEEGVFQNLKWVSCFKQINKRQNNFCGKILLSCISNKNKNISNELVDEKLKIKILKINTNKINFTELDRNELNNFEKLKLSGEISDEIIPTIPQYG